MFDEICNQDQHDFLSGHALVQHLRGRLWHVTSVENYGAIKLDGWLWPNGGDLEGFFKRKGPNLTVCEKLGGVSLFDFDQPDERIFPLHKAWERVGDFFLEWSQFLWLYKPLSVLLVFEKSEIGAGLISDGDCRTAGGQWIYNVEVCHRGALDLTKLAEIVLVCSEGPAEGAFEVFVDHPTSEDISTLIATWAGNGV